MWRNRKSSNLGDYDYVLEPFADHRPSLCRILGISGHEIAYGHARGEIVDIGGIVRENEFRTWLLSKGYAAHSVDSDISRMRRVEAAMPDFGLPDRDLDDAYARDQLSTLLAALQQSIHDLPDKIPPVALVPRSNNYDERLRTALRCTETYQEFCGQSEEQESGAADRVRRYALEHYIQPARNAGRATVEISVREIDEALQLKHHYRNICQALSRPKMQALADVPPPSRTEKNDSPFTIFRFQLSRFDDGQLERLRRLFLEKHPNFRSFDDSASYAPAEDDYKRALQARAGELTEKDQQSDNATLGALLLDLVSGKSGLESNLLDWRVAKLVDDIRKSDPGVIEEAAGRLANAQDGPTAIIEFVDHIWPYLAEKVPASRPFAESRTIPTMIRALVEPQVILGIRSTPTDNAARMLLGRPAFVSRPLAREELDTVLDLARHIHRVMEQKWGWKPRDLWDVQGFIWETCQKRLPALNDDPAPNERMEITMNAPTNLILYGPPGTGKTYATAREAVRLCGEVVPEDRHELMERYRTLSQQGRIEFVTFHQNFSYEDFVEGLRPAPLDTEDGNGAGFQLKPEDGIFRRIADKAGKPFIRRDKAFTLDGRQVFKLSLGEAAKKEWAWVYEQSLEDGCALFGFRDVDWTDPRFSDREEILKELQARFPDEKITIQNGMVKSPDRFRNQLSVGDVVIVSKGLNLFRAIGVVEGEYEYAPRPDGAYCHRRKVRWLWNEPEGVAVSEISDKRFSLDTVYPLPKERLSIEAIERLANSEREDAEAEGERLPHVLVIDEINRANISKVFGELITLIESDKRLGMPNALTVRLPYSKALFGVPANLHILGTMNTADRSIALLDTALRRRFTFREMAPEPALLEEAEARTGAPLQAVLTTINDRIEYLIDREHRIGHAFFIHCSSRDDLDTVMRDKVIPLLQEYFFEDWGRIRAVLGGGFIGERLLNAPPGFDGLERKSWFVLPTFAEDAYQRLLSSGLAENDDLALQSEGLAS